MAKPKPGEFTYPPLPRLSSPFAENIPWFVGADKNNKPDGFTSQPDLAMKDYHGIPVLCPGDVNRVWNKEFERQRKRKATVWNKVLDLMEKRLDLDDEYVAIRLSNRPTITAQGKMEHDRKERAIKREIFGNKAKIEGLLEALIEMELPPGRSTTHEEDLAWIKKRAQDLYDREAG